MNKDQQNMAGGIGGLVLVGVLIYACTGFNIANVFNSRSCKECWGDGKVSVNCTTCSGRGYIGGAKCSTCGGAKKFERTCRFCNGSGKKP